MRRFLAGFIQLTVLATALSCGSDTAAPPQPARLVVAPAVDTLRAIGATAPLAATVLDVSGGVIKNQVVQWSSSNASVAAVDAQGTVTAVSPGEATIQATVKGLSGSALVVVRQAIGSVQVTPLSDTLRAFGSTLRFTAAVTDSLGHAITGRTPAWSSSDTAVAFVSASGQVTARRNGTVTISAAVDGVSGQATAVVDVRGFLKVVVSVSGGGKDADGYAVLVGTASYLMPRDTLTISGLRPGSASITLSNLASNCWSAATAGNATIKAADTVAIAFNLRCAGRYAFVDGYTGSAELGYVDEVGTVRVLATGPIEETPRWSPDGSRIAFSQQVGGNWDLYSIRPDGTGLIHLTSDSGQEKYPLWSPDGKRLLYFECLSGSCSVNTVASDGSDVRVVVSTAGRVNTYDPPSWSPAGDEIAVTRYIGGESRIRLYSTEGLGSRDITSGGIDLGPSWSPDGSLIAFQRNLGNNAYALMVVKPDGTGLKQIGTSGQLNMRPEWSPDGQRIAYVRYTDAYGVYVINRDGTGETRLFGDAWLAFDPAWTPDGRHIYLTVPYEFVTGIGLAQPDGTGQQTVFSRLGPRTPRPRP